MFGSTHSLLVACRCNFQCLCNRVHCVCLLFFAALYAYFFFFWCLQFAHLPYAGGCFLLYTGLYCTRWLCSAVCFFLTFVCMCWLLSVLCAFLGCFLVALLNHCVGCQWYLFLASLPLTHVVFFFGCSYYCCCCILPVSIVYFTFVVSRVIVGMLHYVVGRLLFFVGSLSVLSCCFVFVL